MVPGSTYRQLQIKENREQSHPSLPFTHLYTSNICTIPLKALPLVTLTKHQRPLQLKHNFCPWTHMKLQDVRVRDSVHRECGKWRRRSVFSFFCGGWRASHGVWCFIWAPEKNSNDKKMCMHGTPLRSCRLHSSRCSDFALLIIRWIVPSPWMLIIQIDAFVWALIRLLLSMLLNRQWISSTQLKKTIAAKTKQENYQFCYRTI